MFLINKWDTHYRGNRSGKSPGNKLVNDILSLLKARLASARGPMAAHLKLSNLDPSHSSGNSLVLYFAINQ